MSNCDLYAATHESTYQQESLRPLGRSVLDLEEVCTSLPSPHLVKP